MNRRFIYRFFKHWLKKNRSKFKAIPYISMIRRNNFVIRFQGIDGLLVNVRSDHFAVWYVNKKLGMDWYGDIEASYGYRNGRFYCGFCDETFTNRKEAFEKHSYEVLLDFINKKIDKDNFVYFFGNPELTSIKIDSKDRLNEYKSKDSFLEYRPLFRRGTKY